jgi:hypothetical protein
MSTGSYLARRAIYQNRHLDAPAGGKAEPQAESGTVLGGAVGMSDEKHSPERRRDEERLTTGRLRDH